VLPSTYRARARLNAGASNIERSRYETYCDFTWLPGFCWRLSLAQNAPEQPGTGNRMSQDKTPGAGMMGMHHMHDMSKMHEQMMKENAR
jgi:hypothetical protein